MADIFNEVDDELRQQRAADAFKRFWPWVTGALALALVAALAFAGWRAWSDRQAAEGAAAYDKAVTALGQGKLDDADKGFAEAAKHGSAGYRALSLMQQAGVKLTRNQTGPGLALLEQASRTSHDPMLADAALLEAAFAQMDAAPLAQTQASLLPLTGADRPYRDLAREAIAMAKLAAGKAAEARVDFSTLSIQPDVSQGARSRARSAVAMIDSGVAASIPASLKAELALPPPSPQDAAAAALAARDGAQ